jgi:hypothetical protein
MQSNDDLDRMPIGDPRLDFCGEDQVLLVLIVKIGQGGSVYRG